MKNEKFDHLLYLLSIKSFFLQFISDFLSDLIQLCEALGTSSFAS